MKTPRGKTPSLLSGSNGHPKIVIAKRSRTCSRCSAKLAKGVEYCEIPRMSTGFINKKPFCISCIKLIIAKTREDLDKIEAELQ